jgi:heme/copper-type cytochrome/quinol oxidase subunit 2
MLIVLSVLYPSFAILYSMDLDPSESPLITVKVIGHQWY